MSMVIADGVVLDLDPDGESRSQRPTAVEFVPRTTDEQAAELYRQRVTEALGAVAAIMNEARRERNFQVIFGMAEDQGGRSFVGNLQIVKRL